MRPVRNTAAILALLCSSGAAAAGYLNLSGAQEQLIYQTLKKVKVQNPPEGYRPTVGDRLPPTFTTSKLPQHITDRVPTTRDLEYVRVRGRKVILVDPKHGKVVDFIWKQ
jgi:hypothetical protein